MFKKGDKVRITRTGEIGTVVWIGLSNATPALYEVELARGIVVCWQYQLERASTDGTT